MHISLSCSFTEGWSYHENLLPYWHLKMGNEVVLVARNKQHVGQPIVECDCEHKIMDNGVELFRIKVKEKKINSWSKPDKKELFSIIEKNKPDIVWVHNVMDCTIKLVSEYKKTKDNNLIIIGDNHVDFSNYGKDILRKINLLFISCRLKKITKHIKTFYGVTPGRCLFLKEQLRIPEDKIKLSIQGGNPEDIDYDNKTIIRDDVRSKHSVSNSDFVYCIGGKLTREKRLMSLVYGFTSCQSNDIRLFVFGSICAEDEKAFFDAIKNDKRIIYFGFLNNKEISDVFLASDLGFFPGRHSVLWEKALSCGLPCIFEQKEGYEHVYSGGGAARVSELFPNNIFDYDSFRFTKKYLDLKKNAEANRTMFLYDEIARKTIEENS